MQREKNEEESREEHKFAVPPNIPLMWPSFRPATFPFGKISKNLFLQIHFQRRINSWRNNNPNCGSLPTQNYRSRRLWNEQARKYSYQQRKKHEHSRNQKRQHHRQYAHKDNLEQWLGNRQIDETASIWTHRGESWTWYMAGIREIYFGKLQIQKWFRWKSF